MRMVGATGLEPSSCVSTICRKFRHPAVYPVAIKSYTVIYEEPESKNSWIWEWRPVAWVLGNPFTAGMIWCQ